MLNIYVFPEEIFRDLTLSKRLKFIFSIQLLTQFLYNFLHSFYTTFDTVSIQLLTHSFYTTFLTQFLYNFSHSFYTTFYTVSIQNTFKFEITLELAETL